MFVVAKSYISCLRSDQKLSGNAMDSGEQNGTVSSLLTVDDVDVEFLPLIYEIIRRSVFLVNVLLYVFMEMEMNCFVNSDFKIPG